MVETVPVSCNKDCGAGCPLEALVEDGMITRISDSRYGTRLMKGCLKGYKMTEVIYHKDRILHPLIRTGRRGSGLFRKATWEEALDLTAGRLEETVSVYGAEAIMRIGGSGSCRGALHNTGALAKRFFGMLGNYTNTAGNFSCEASNFVKPYMFGTSLTGIDVKTLSSSELIILWGFNPSDTRFGCETESVLRDAAAAGIRIIVIDPRRTSTVDALKAEWISLKAGTDSILMLAVLYTLLEKDLADRDFIYKYSTGFDSLESYLKGRTDGQPKSPEWAEPLCGIEAGDIRKLAYAYAEASPAALLPGLSLQRAIGGENSDRLGAVLQLATGNTGIMGGSSGTSQWNRIKAPACGSIDDKVNPDILNVPVYLWADAVLGGKASGFPSDIKVLYNVGGNYLGQSSDSARGIEAFSMADFTVSHDYFMTPTCRWSDVVFPVTTFLEREDILFSNTNYLFYSAPASLPVGEARNDYRIFADLAGRLGFGERYTGGKSEQEWIDSFISESEIADPEEFRRTGIYAGKNQSFTGLSGFIADPELNQLETPSGKIEISLPEFAPMGGTVIPEPVLQAATPNFPLKLITPHDKFRIHSQNDNIMLFRKLTDRRIWINPSDALPRGIAAGDSVRVTSPEGSISAEAFVTDRIMEGTVSVNQGVWLEWPENEEEILNRINGSVNILTSTEPTYPSRGSRTHSTIVDVVPEI